MTHVNGHVLGCIMNRVLELKDQGFTTQEAIEIYESEKLDENDLIEIVIDLERDERWKI